MAKVEAGSSANKIMPNTPLKVTGPISEEKGPGIKITPKKGD